MKVKIVIPLKIIGFLLVLIATLIITVLLQTKSEQISQVNNKISDFKDDRIMAALCVSHYSEQITQRRIWLLEANLTALMNEDKDSIESKLNMALDITNAMTKEWAVLLSGDRKEEFLSNVMNQINEIESDKNINIKA